MTTTPDPVDVHVGTRVRLRRKQEGKSQQQLADSLDLTFQQVQKYERGTNRISASKLYAIAKYLGVSIGYFFGGLESEADSDDAAGDAMFRLFRTSQGADIAEAFTRLSPAMRTHFASLLLAMVKELPEPDPA